MKRRVYNAITGEWLDKTANKVNNNERRKVYNAITGEWLEDSFAQNTPKISNNTQQIDEQYLDTGKTYGDYWYQEYSTRKDDKIYSKGGKYYVFNSKTGDYQDVDKISYMTNADVDAKQLEEAQKNGYKGNKADLIKISNKILLDTGDLTKKEYAEYAKDLKRQEEKLNNEQKEKTKIRYSGTGIDAVKQIGSNVSDLSYSANKEIINPIVNFNDNYNIGKQNNELALEYYKKMEGKKNNAEQLEQKINKFNRYNKDLITNPGAAGSAIQNLNTQVESFKKQGLATIAGGTIGGIIGGTSGALAGGAGAIPGAISGAKTGATIGYTFGGVPYTYKLEAGNQYKELVSAGIPEKIAKDVSRKTGAINAAIESGENIVDIITLGQAGKLTGAAQQELYDQLEKAYGKKALKTLLIKTGYSYGQNILSESMEEMYQEGTSIHYEKEAFKKAGIDRNVTTEEDLDRVLEAGKSAAISTAFTAPITSLSGSIVTNVVNNLQIKANDRINTISKAEINDEIKKQVINYNNQNSTNLSADEILSIQKQVNNNLEQNNVTIVDNKTEKTLPTVYDIVAQEKVKKERGTSNSTVASSFSDNNISQTNEYVNSINNAKLVKYTDHEIDNFKNGRVKIANNSSDIDIFIETAKKAPSNAKLYFGKIGSNIAKKIKSKLGVEIENYNLSLSANAINHILKNHGDIKTETDRGQVAINDNDFKLIPQIVTEFDDVIDSGLTTEGKKVITFKKRIGDTYYLINYVSDKNHNLEVKTMYKQKKKNSATASDELNPQSWTSETDSGTSSFSDNNIPQINENVKLPIVSNNDMQNIENNTNKMKLPTKQNIDSNMRSLEKTAPLIEEKNTLGYIPQDPTRESTYDDPITQPITEFQRALDREMEYGIKSPKEIKKKNNLRHQVSETYGWLQEQFVNRNYEINKYAKQTNNNEIMFKGDMLNSVAGEVSGEINVAQTDNYGHKIGESLSSLFKKSKEKGYYEQFDDYLKHYSNIDRHKYGKGSIVPLEYSQKMVQYYEKTIPGIKEEASKVWKYGRNILDNLEENGLITKEYKKGTLEEMYPHYVPYMQSESMVPYMDDSGEIKPKKVIKRAEGNAHDLVTIEESFARYTYAAKKAIRQNDLYKEIVKSTKEKVSFGADDRVDPTQLDNSLMRDSEGNNYLTAYVDGLQQQVKINDNLYNELLRTDEKRIKAVEEKLSLVIKPLQKLSEIRRNILTTWNLSFVLTNPIKDIQDGLFNSKYTKDFAMYLPTSIYELATQSTETARQFSSLYGSGMVMGDYQVDKLNNAVKNMDIKQVNKLLKIIPNANELVELAPRYAEFKASLKNGTSVTEAMYNAREVTTNFNRGGYITKALNRDGFTFLNASVQGFDKLIRNLTGINGTKGFIGGVTGIMTKVAVLGIAPALFNAMSFGAGDDEEDEDYKALPNYIKDNYYLFKVKGLGNKSNKYYDGTFIRIPKGRMLSVFGSAARRTLEYTKGDKNAFDGYLENVQSQIGINNPEENNIFAPIKQAFGSKNGEAWYGGDLVPKRLQNKPVAEQYDESTDEFSKWLGEMLNISPYKINYLLDQYSGGTGDIILPMITSETTNGATKVSDYLLAPIKDKFIVNSTDDNKYASNFYILLEKTQIQANSDKATDSDKLKYKYMTSINSELSKLYKEKREIQMNDTLSKKEKYKKVQNIQKEINELSKEGTKIPKVKDLKSNYAKLNNDEYYKNKKGTWTKIKEEETNQLKELNMSANEKNEYFIAKNKIGVIRNNEDLENDVKKNQISNIIIDLNMSDDKLSYLYSKYYSSEETLEVIKSAGISIKEFIKYNSQDFTTDYYSNGKAIPNSRENKVIKYVNSLNLSIPQKALLIKMEYSSYKKYDKQIAEYVNSMNISFLDKASILKKAGFTSYDKQIINYVNKMNISKSEKEEILEEMGFTIRNGRVYS